MLCEYIGYEVMSLRSHDVINCLKTWEITQVWDDVDRGLMLKYNYKRVTSGKQDIDFMTHRCHTLWIAKMKWIMLYNE